jgi:lipoprotein signal peptidase
MPAGKSSPIHKLGGVVMILLAVVLLTQVVMFLVLSDEDLVEMSKAATKAKRDQTTFTYPMRPLSDEEIDQNIEEDRASILKKNKANQVQVIGIKTVAALALLGIAFGLFTNRRSPTKLLAGIVGVLLVIATIYVIKDAKESLNIYSYIRIASAGTMNAIHMAVIALVPLGAIFCIITLIMPPKGKGTKKDDEPLQK